MVNASRSPQRSGRRRPLVRRPDHLGVLAHELAEVLDVLARDRVADQQDRLAANPVKIACRYCSSLVPVVQAPELLEEARRLTRYVVGVPSVQVWIGKVDL